MPPTNINSPCRGQCDIDKQQGVCFGCFRKIDEIKSWHRCSDEKKRLYLDLAESRKNVFLQHHSHDSTSNNEQIKHTKNPCQGECTIDTKTFLCKGCYMYPEEIKNWHVYTAIKQHRLLSDIKNRRIKYRLE